MNPRAGQYGLGRTLDGWERLTTPSPAQSVRLRTAYRGWNPFVYSRFGRRQWAAPLPWTRLVVKDPYALISMPAVATTTGALPVLVYRHPGAVLASFRRVGWTPRLDELAAVVSTTPAGAHLAHLLDLPRPGDVATAEEIGAMWTVLHELALADVDAAGAVVVSHSELARGGAPAAQLLAARLGLTWSAAMGEDLARSDSAAADTGQLHHFDRAPAAVAEEWRAKLPADDLERIDAITAETLARVGSARLDLSVAPSAP